MLDVAVKDPPGLPHDKHDTMERSNERVVSTTLEDLQLEKAALQHKLDMIYQREKDMAVKAALNDIKVSYTDIRLKLSEETSGKMVAMTNYHEEEKALAIEKVRGEMLLHHQHAIKKLRESFEADKVNAIEEARPKIHYTDLSTTKRVYEEEGLLSIERTREEMVEQHRKEKEMLREYYEAKMANAVEVALAELRGEMQIIIENEKEKTLNWLRGKVMHQQQQQGNARGLVPPNMTLGRATLEDVELKIADTTPSTQKMDSAVKALGRTLDGDLNALEYSSAPKRLKLSGSDHAAVARPPPPSPPLLTSAVNRVVSLTNKQGETKSEESICLWNNPLHTSSHPPLSNGTAPYIYWQKKPPQEQLDSLLQSRVSFTTRAEAIREVYDEDLSKEPHCTAVEALLFAAEKMEESTDGCTSATISSSRKNPKKKPKRIIDESRAIEPNINDVLFGRGGFVNTHPGNIHFRQKAFELRPWYEASTKEEKFNISKVLIESVKGEGNRFLEKTADGLWHEVSGNGIRKKASQALRERVRGRNSTTPTKTVGESGGYSGSEEGV